ncbi:armadillo repeat-containing protein 5 [Corythoichthys intestinalis]|uniref:armadillo repeat-containing protein 5 n=1 Tax=Corythoichthys intestinalis TaxID=161448 RepID=UPI0025A5D88B|nr:armadillo repeat-containing protein 5 [Corythoichthys intestinalis]XP_061805531.1 armadillo repeat-containing protein 5-like [Nerophis lumbriciformis]
MTALPIQSVRKQCRASSNREGSPSAPESSLTWCLAHLSKPPPDSEVELVKRSRFAQWRALVAIRTQHIKGDKAGITRFRTQGGLRPLLDLLGHPGCSRKTLDLTLSILANCCTEQETRIAVRKLDGIKIVVDVMKRNVAHETIQNRAARALGNLAMDSENSALIHSAGGVPLLLLCMSLPSTPSSPTSTPPIDACPKLECAQSASRALLYLSDAPANRLSLLTQGALSAVAPFVATEFPQGLRRAALKTLHELTRSCGPECAREASRSGVLAQLGIMASGEAGKPFEELALKTLANLCSQGCLRPLVGSLGVIPKFTAEAKKDPHKSGVFFRALCLCCKEAVNRAKVKESGGLEVLVGFLAAHPSHPLARLAILACVDFVFDESAVEQLQDLGLVPLLVARLEALTVGDKTEAEAGGGASSASAQSESLSPSCLDSFDFAPFEDCKKDEGGKEQGSSSFLRLRSWLLSEGMISSEEDLLDSSNSADGDWASSPAQSSPKPDCLTPLKPRSPLNAATSKKEALSSSPSPWKAASPTSKFSSPHRRRQRTPGAISSSAELTVDAPPLAPRPFAYRHPYHPEPWTPESPVLLLLSRFSHAAEPSPALLTSGTVSGLLRYLGQHRDPSGRCFRLLCRLSCNPGCLRALVRTGAVALIHHKLCQSDDGVGRQQDRVRTKVKQLGVTLLNNLHIQCESSFGAGIVTHVMLSGSEADRVNCALSLPLISSNKLLLRKLLIESGSFLLALQPLSCRDDADSHTPECKRLLSAWPDSADHSLYFCLLMGCLSPLVSSIKPDLGRAIQLGGADRAAPPPCKKPRHADICPYATSDFDLLLLLDDGVEIPANRDALAGTGSEYFRALLNGAFGEANSEGAIRIKDVTEGMLVPVLHYLHGCRLVAPNQTEKCQFLDSLGFVSCRSEEPSFQDSPLGATMTGACRFLATELKVELEERCVARLLSETIVTTPKMDRVTAPPAGGDRDTVEEHLASRTSELDLTCVQPQLETLLEKNVETSTFTHKKEKADTIYKVKSFKSLPENEKSVLKSSAQLLKEALPEEEAEGGAGGAVAVLLPQMYGFAQRYSYPALRRACLALLLGGRDAGRRSPFSPREAAQCLREVAGQADCVDTLKQDLLSLVADALN